MAIPSGPTRTMVDIELEHAPRGEELATGVAQRMRDRAPMAMAPTRLPKESGALTMTWADFQVRHPEWRGEYWEECRALYAGGDRLLGNPGVMKRLFPAHFHEAGNVYEERKKRAHYYPYAGTIIDHLLAGLGTDPLALAFTEIDPDTGEEIEAPAEAEWWERWSTDVTDEAERPADYGLETDDDEEDDQGGRELHDFTVDVLREAMQTRTAWVLVDLPRVTDDAPPDDDPLPDPYLCIVPAEQVIDWQTNDRGKLTWAMIMTCEQVRDSPKARRGMIRHTYVVWDAERWAKYVIDVNPTQLPTPDTQYQPVDTNSHAFGRVPLERCMLPEGLHAMGKMHSLAREHLNKRCAMSWAEYKSLFAILYEFNGPEDKLGLPVAEAQTDSNRSVNQVRGQGYTQTRGADDRAEYIGPAVDPFVAARESCNDAMREMHRVMFSMALSVDMTTAAKLQSGESKEKDHATIGVILDALGKIARRFVRRLLVLAALGRGEAPPKSRLTGCEQFDVAGTTEAIAEAVDLFNGVPMKSPTFAKLYLSRFYLKLLGDVTPEQREAIMSEIDEANSAEELMQEAMIEGAAGNTNGAPGAPKPPGDDDDDPPAPKPAQPAKPAGKMYSSKRPKR